MGKKEGTHVVNEDRGLFGSLEERRVGGVLEVASVLLKGRFVQSLLPTNENAMRHIKDVERLNTAIKITPI